MTVGKWYVEKNVDKATLNGTAESWANSTNQVGTSSFYRYSCTTFTDTTIYKANSPYISNKFVFSADSLTENNTIASTGVEGLQRLFITIDTTLMSGNTVADFKTWLGSNNVLVYYIKVTPTYKEITSGNLIYELEQASQLLTYNGINNIFVESSGTNEAPLLNIAYRQNIQDIVNKKIEEVKVDGVALPIVDHSVDIVGIGALQNETSALLDQIPVKQVSGDLINVQDSSNLPFKEIDVFGNATQITTTGKNLFKPYSHTRTAGSFTFTTNTDGSITANGTSSSSFSSITSTDAQSYTFTLTAGTYTLSGGYSNNLFVQVVDTSGTALASSKTSATQFTLESDTEVYVRAYVNSNTTVSNIVLKPMVEAGSTASSYEPYTGGKASPSPDYPQDIHVVTGDNTLKVVGKNLFDGSNPKTATNVTVAFSNDILSLTEQSSVRYATWEFNVKQGDIVNISGIVQSQYGRLRLYYYDTSWHSSTNRDYTNGTDIATISYTVPSGVSKVAAYVYASNTSQSQETTSTYKNVIVTINNSNTTYEPYTETTQVIHLGNLELAKIGDYTDKIFKAIDGNSIYDSLDSTTKASLTSGSWYKQGNIGKVVFDGSEEGWTLFGNTSVRASFYISLSNVKRPATATTNSNLLSNYFISVSENDSWTPGTISLRTSNSNIYLNVASGTSLGDFKTWLSTHNTTVYYILATPTYTEITDTTLIGELNEVENWTTYKNITNMWIKPSGTNAQASQLIIYRQDLQTLTDKIEALEARVALIE